MTLEEKNTLHDQVTKFLQISSNNSRRDKDSSYINTYVQDVCFEIRVSNHGYNPRNVSNHSCLFDHFIDAVSLEDVKEGLRKVFGSVVVKDLRYDSEGYTVERKIDLTK